MRFSNPTDRAISLASLDLPSVLPHSEIDIPDEHCSPGRTAEGKRQPSAIEQVAPQLRPVDPPAWYGATPPLREPALDLTLSRYSYYSSLEIAKAGLPSADDIQAARYLTMMHERLTRL